MSILEHFQGVPIEVDLAIKVQLHESLHWDLVTSAILGLFCGILEGKIVLNWATWELRFLGLARTEG